MLKGNKILSDEYDNDLKHFASIIKSKNGENIVQWRNKGAECSMKCEDLIHDLNRAIEINNRSYPN